MYRQSLSGLLMCSTMLQHILHIVHSPLLSLTTAIRMAILPFLALVSARHLVCIAVLCIYVYTVLCIYIYYVYLYIVLVSLVQLAMHKQTQS